MIPRLTSLPRLSSLYAEFIDELRSSGFEGDIRSDYGSRVVTATDNSVYQVVPEAIVYPRSTRDVETFVASAAKERFREVVIAPRGGGTGTNGQSLCEGVIIDVSRHMNEILELNLEEGWVRVQPGVVLDQLNQFLEPHGVFFAPTVAPSNRATLGGMISTDACGRGSRIYGRTSEHVIALTSVFLDGSFWTSEAIDETTLAHLKNRPDFVGEIHRVIDSIVTENQALIDASFPKLTRFLTGYNLGKVRGAGPNHFNLNWLLTGSEGTLGIVTEAKLKLSPIPKDRCLVVLRYDTFNNALGSAEWIVTTDPAAIETIDETVLALAREDIIWDRVSGILREEDGRHTAAVNLVEYADDDPDGALQKATALIEAAGKRSHLKNDAFEAIMVRTPENIEALWDLRKKGVGLLGNKKGPRKPVAFVEDTVVAPEKLQDYIREFRAILDAAGLEYGMYGHIDVGCLHVRPALDLKDAKDEELLRLISDKVVTLVQKYGGLIWGEHGKGMRSEYNPEFFGEDLYHELCRVKSLFDPLGRLNPGKIAVPLNGSHQLATIDATKRGTFDREIGPSALRHWEKVTACNGNGACFDWNPDTIMCPSSKVSRARLHSPKGRADLMREWLRLLTQSGFDPVQALDKTGLGLLPRGKEADFSHEVYDAMDGCLACKACATLCPIHVDVATFRSEFLALYHARYQRPLADYFSALLETAAPFLAMFPRVTNYLTGTRLIDLLLSKIGGIVDVPPLSVPTAAKLLRQRHIERFDPGKIGRLSLDEREKLLLVLPDAFTTYFDAPVLSAVCDLVEGFGFRAVLFPYRPSGKALHVKGFFPAFKRKARKILAFMEQVAQWNLPVVGVEPAVVLFLRDEVKQILGSKQSPKIALLQEWLVKQAVKNNPPQKKYVLFGHCTERSAVPGSQKLWQSVFERSGLTLEIAEVGCCGMCGAFGHEIRHRDASIGIFNLSWGPAIEKFKGREELILVTGYSCRSQVKRLLGFRPRHPAEVLSKALKKVSRDK